jgi:hypothetical protein
MKNLKISLQEKYEILKKHGSLLNEQPQTTPANKTIMDIQNLVGVTDDNIVGPLTIQAIKKKIEGLPKPVNDPKTAEKVDGSKPKDGETTTTSTTVKPETVNNKDF